MIEPILKKKNVENWRDSSEEAQVFSEMVYVLGKKKIKRINPNLELKEYIPQENIKPKK